MRVLYLFDKCIQTVYGGCIPRNCIGKTANAYTMPNVTKKRCANCKQRLTREEQRRVSGSIPEACISRICYGCNYAQRKGTAMSEYKLAIKRRGRIEETARALDFATRSQSIERMRKLRELYANYTLKGETVVIIDADTRQEVR